MGHFDYNNIVWGYLVGDSETALFIEIVQGDCLKQFASEPTRGSNIRNLLLCNKNMIISLEIGNKLANSEHEEVRFSINFSSPTLEQATTSDQDNTWLRLNGMGLWQGLTLVNWECERIY